VSTQEAGENLSVFFPRAAYGQGTVNKINTILNFESRLFNSSRYKRLKRLRKLFGVQSKKKPESRKNSKKKEKKSQVILCLFSSFSS